MGFGWIVKPPPIAGILSQKGGVFIFVAANARRPNLEQW